MKVWCLVLFVVFDSILADLSTLKPTSPEAYPVYNAPELTENNKYVPSVPHKTYKDIGVQPDLYSSYYPYEDYSSYPLQSTELTSQGPLQTTLSLIYKTGFFIIGGAALLFVGGLFMTAVCSLTSFCTISFASLGNVDKDTMMRSFMTPEKLATAAALVQDAFGKYQRLQKTQK